MSDMVESPSEGIGWTYRLVYRGLEIPLREGDLVVGRSRSCPVRIDDESVSRSHALLTIRDGQVTIRDLGSSNGTFVGGYRVVKDSRLKDGDSLRFGGAIATIQIVPPAAPAERTAAVDALGKCSFCASVVPPEAAICPQCGSAVARGVGAYTRRIEDLPTRPPASAGALEPIARDIPTPPPAPPEQPALSGVAAAPSRRVAGFALDALLCAMLALACMLPALAAYLLRSDLRSSGGRGDPIFLLLAALCFGVAFAAVALYFVLGWTGHRGTPGERAMGLRVESVEGGAALTWRAALLRFIGLLIGLATGGLLFLSVLFDREGRGFHDHMAGSRVVREGGNRAVSLDR
jgi:uncharacterized RDD family membrane protein YckC